VLKSRKTFDKICKRFITSLKLFHSVKQQKESKGLVYSYLWIMWQILILPNIILYIFFKQSIKLKLTPSSNKNALTLTILGVSILLLEIDLVISNHYAVNETKVKESKNFKPAGHHSNRSDC